MFKRYPKIHRLGKEETDGILIGTCHNDNNIYYDELYMRTPGDMRKDFVIKKELYDAKIKNKYNVQFVLDDRNQIVDMWRGLGMTCLQVDYGNF